MIWWSPHRMKKSQEKIDELVLLVKKLRVGQMKKSQEKIDELDRQIKESISKFDDEYREMDRSRNEISVVLTSDTLATLDLNYLVKWLSSYINRINKIDNTNMDDDYNSMDSYTNRYRGIEADIQDSNLNIDFGNLRYILNLKLKEYNNSPMNKDLSFKDWLFLPINQTLDKWFEAMAYVYFKNSTLKIYKEKLMETRKR